MDTLGARLKRLREVNGYSVLHVAKQTGISASCIARTEAELHDPTFMTLLRLSNFYGVTLDSLVPGRERVKVKAKKAIAS